MARIAVGRRARAPARTARRRRARRRAPRPSRRPSARRRRRRRPRARRPLRGRREQRGEVVALARPPACPRAGGRGARAHWQAGDAEAGVGLVALVHVHDHRGHALERAGARERAGVERAAGDEPRRRARARAPSRRRRRRRRARPRPAARRARFAAASEWRPATTGRVERRPAIRSAIESPRAVGFTPPGPKRELRARRRAPASRRSRRRARARSRAPRPPSTARTTRSAPRTASSFVAPSAPSGAAASRARSASREPITTVVAGVDEPLGDAPPEAAGAADDRDLSRGGLERRSRRAAARVEVGHQRARRRSARTRELGSVGSASSITSASIRPS